MKKFTTFTNVDYPLTPRVPEHWQALPCRAFVAEKLEKNNDGIEREYLSLMSNVGVIKYSEKGDVGNKAPEDLTKCKIVQEGNLVINSMNYSIGSYGISPYNGVCSPVYIVLEPIKSVISRRFALRVFENKEFQNWAQSFGSGILAHRAAIGWDDLKNIIVGIPPLSEQQKIAQFLDYETAKIDALIDEQKRLIELLKEKRQAVISHAVTKGLNPDAPMKDSGVEWLGDVPEHWKVIKGSYIGQIFGSEAISESEVSEAGELPFVKVSDLSKHGLKPKVFSWYIDTDKAYKVRARANFIAFPKRGAAIFLNKVNIIPCKALLDPNLMGWQISNEHSAPFMAYVLKMRGLQELADVSTVPQINAKHIIPEKFPAPSLKEQEEIVNYLTRTLGSLSSLANISERTIELLQERRSALISAAVTGKIDVRDWQPPEDADLIDSNAAVQMESQDG